MSKKKKIKRKQQYKRPQERTFKEWWADQTEQNRKRIICACVAVLAVIALALGYYYGIYDDGSLRVSRGELVGAQENWLVGERNKGKNSAYYHIADVEVPDGYTRAEDAISRSGTDLRRDMTFVNGAENEIMIYVAPVKNTMDEMINSIHSTFGNMAGERGAITEISSMETALGVCKYFEYHYSYDNEDGSEAFTQSLVCYTPSRYANNCILVSASVSPASADGFYTEEELLADVRKTIEGITLVQ